MTNEVALVRCENYDPETLKSSLRRAIELCPPPEVRGKKVLLKPNILWDSPPEMAITTHPEVVRCAVELFREKGAEVYVGDSPGLHPRDFEKDSCGIRKAAESAGAGWVDFAGEKITVDVPGKGAVKKFTVSAIANEVDLIVSMPKMKTHTLMYYTGAMKNLFGLVPGTLKASFHARFPGRESFARVMVDLNTAVMAGYALMDAVIGIEGPGPGKAGKPKRIGAVMASTNLLAMDIITAGMMGYDAAELPMNRNALQRGIWLTSPEDIVIKGESPESIAPETYETVPMARRRNALIEYLITNLSMTFRSKRRPLPSFSDEVCIKCGECIEICPAGALAFSGRGKDKRVVLNRKACVRCYCCHEICPVGAISV